MSLWSKILNRKYFFLSLLLLFTAVFDNIFLLPLSRVNYAIIIFLLILEDIDTQTYLNYSLIFGIYSDLLQGSFIGVSVFIYLLIAGVKILIENNVDLMKPTFMAIFSFASILIYNILSAMILGYNIFLDLDYMINSTIIYFIPFIIIYFIKRVILYGIPNLKG